MSMGDILANTSAASVDIVPKPQIIRIAESRCTVGIDLAYHNPRVNIINKY